MAETEFSTRALRDAMLRASTEIKADVLARMDRAASSLTSYLQGQYPVGKTGNLRKGVSKRPASTFGFVVRSTAKHVHFLEQGTRDRFDNTRRNARRGRVTARPIFVPAASRERRSFLADAQSILDRDRQLV